MRIHVCFFVLFATALSFVGCEEEPGGSSGSAGNQGKPCDREEDCDDENSCTYEFCVDGSCTDDVLNGVEDPDAEQVDGDCQMNGCQEGTPAVLPDNEPPEDPDQGDCVVKECMDGAAMDVLRPSGDGCFFNNMDGVCNAAGACSCTPNAPTDEHFVDPVNGTDSATNGGRYGGCAFKTLSYALSVAEGPIRVPSGLYTSMSGESPPYVLSGTQDILCENFDSMPVILRGGGSFSGTTTVIALTGTANLVDNCVIEASGAASGIAISSVATVEHEIDNVNVSGATTGIAILATGNEVRVQDSNIHDNGTGLQWLGMAKSGNIDNNTFGGNTTDIVCADPSPDLNGGNNGGPSCQVCMNCPF